MTVNENTSRGTGHHSVPTQQENLYILFACVSKLLGASVRLGVAL